jgi:chitodextrinase
VSRITAGRLLAGGRLAVPPAPKVYFGADDDHNFTGTNGIETSGELGRRMAIRREHFPFGNGPGGKGPGQGGTFPWPNALARSTSALTSPKVAYFIAHGSQGSGATGFPVKTAGGGYSNTTGWSSGGHTYKGIDIITAGGYDAPYTAAFAAIAAIDAPIFFNLWMEMNIPAMGAYGGYQGGTGGAGQAAYIAAYRHLHDLAVAAGADNMIWVWCPTQFDPDGNKLTYYPGDDVVDWIMLDLYRHQFSGNVDDIYNFAVSHAKPFGIAENGYGAWSGNNSPKVTKDQMVAELRSSILLPKYQETSALILWNYTGSVDDDHIDVAWSNSTGTKSASLSAAALQAMQDLSSASEFSGYYSDFGGGGGGGSDTTAPSAPTTIAGQATGPGSARVDWSGATDNVGVDHYEVWRSLGSVAFAQVASPSSSPFLDSGLIAATTYHYEVRAVDAAGNRSAFTTTVAVTTPQASGGSFSLAPIPDTPGFYSSAWTSTNNDVGRMWGAAERNGVVYVVGESDHTIDHSGGGSVDRTTTPMIAAYNKATGAVIQTYAPAPDDIVRGCQLLSDGTLAVWGAFSAIAGSTRHGFAILNTLSGPTDTTAASVQAASPDLQFTGGIVTRMVIQDGSSRGWAVGTFTSAGGSAVHKRVARIVKSGGTWGVDSAFTASIASGTCKGLGAKSDGSKIIVGGDIPNALQAFNGVTGAAMSWGFQFPSESGAQHCLSITVDDNFVVQTGDFGQGGGAAICTDWNGGGPNNLSAFSTQGYWYAECDGNVQASAKLSINGVDYAAFGHHGNFVMPKKNTAYSTGSDVASDGMFLFLWGSSTTDTVAYNTISFQQTSGESNPLKLWFYSQDPVSGSIDIGGDFGQVNGDTDWKRYIRLDGAGGTQDTTPPAAPSNLQATAVSDTTASLRWTASPDSDVAGYQVLRGSVIVGTVSAGVTSFVDSGLTAVTTYTYTVKAIDTSGNVSSASNAVSVTTSSGGGGGQQAPLWSQPPSLSDLAPFTGEAVTVVDGIVTGSPAPTIVSEVQEASNSAAAAIVLEGAWGFGAF